MVGICSEKQSTPARAGVFCYYGPSEWGLSMDWHILTVLPLLGLTNSWRGVRIGGKVIGGVGGFGASNNPAVQAFDKAKAAGDREGMERAARQLNEQRMERNRAQSNAGGAGAVDSFLKQMVTGEESSYQRAVEMYNKATAELRAKYPGSQRSDPEGYRKYREMKDRLDSAFDAHMRARSQRASAEDKPVAPVSKQDESRMRRNYDFFKQQQEWEAQQRRNR